MAFSQSLHNNGYTKLFTFAIFFVIIHIFIDLQ